MRSAADKINSNKEIELRKKIAIQLIGKRKALNTNSISNQVHNKRKSKLNIA